MQRRLHDAEQLAASGLEEVRKEAAGAGSILEQHIARFAAITGELQARCAALERQAAIAVEDAAGRFEALASALGEVVALR